MRLTVPLATLLLVAPPHRPAAMPPHLPDSQLAAAVDSLAAYAIARGLSPGLGVAVVRQGRTILSRGYGYADATRRVVADDRTLWYLASTSKSFTGFALALLVDRGAVAWDTPLNAALPQVQWNERVDASRITLAHLVSHTHGLSNAPLVPVAAFSGSVPESRWPFLLSRTEPTGSTDLVYGNIGYNIAAMVIDAHHARGWKDFQESELFRPAGMRETYTRVSEVDPRRLAMPHVLRADGSYATVPFEKQDATMNAAGGHLSTLGDLARWTIIQMDSGTLEGRRIFPARVVAASHELRGRQTREEAKRFAYFVRDGWGAGWDVGSYEGERMVSRFGSYHSTRSHLSFLPGRRIGVIAQVNGPGASAVTDVIAAYVYDLDRGLPSAREQALARLDALVPRLEAARRQVAVRDSARAARQHDAIPRELSAYLGTYEDSLLGRVTVTREGERLRWRWGVLSGLLEKEDAARSAFRIEFAGTSTGLAFTIGASGPATALAFQGTTFQRQE